MSEDLKELSEENLDQVLQFAQGLYSNFGQYGLFNPFNSNDTLLKVNNNPLKPTKEQLEKALSSVPYDRELVSRYSEFMQIWDNIYNNTLAYYQGLLSYDLSWVCTNANGNDYNSKEYKDDIKRLNKFFDKFDYKNEFNKVTNEVLKKGASFLWFRDTNSIDEVIDITSKKSEKFGLQIMPDKYCKIVGYTSSGLALYDFNVDYFLQSNVDIKLFAPELIRKFKKAYSKDTNNYIPSNNIGNRNGVYGRQWVQTDYRDGAFVVKAENGNYRIVPPFASLMKSCLSTDEIESLKRDRDILGSYYLLSGTIQLLNDTKTSKANQFALSPEVLGKFLQLVTSGLTKNVKSIAMPLDETKGWQYQNYDLNMLPNHLRSTSAQGASASELVFHTDNLSQFAMQNAIETDYARIEPLYRQYENLLNIFVNRKTKKYKFKFTLTGLNRSWARKDRLENLTKLADKGILLGESQWASCLGMTPSDFSRSLEEAHNSSFTDNLTLLMNANTMKGSSEQTENPNGRPKSDLLDRSDKSEEVSDYVD